MKASYSGVNKDVQILSELTSAVPGREGHVIKQITETWKYTSPNTEFDGALGIAVDQQEIVGDQLEILAILIAAPDRARPTIGVIAGPRLAVLVYQSRNALIADAKIEFAVWPKSHFAAIVVRSRRYGQVQNQSRIDQSTAVPGVTIHAVSERWRRA